MNDNECLLINECRKKILNEINIILSDISHQKTNEFNFLNKNDDLFPKNVVAYKSCIIVLFAMTEFNENSDIFNQFNPFEISNLLYSKDYEIVKNISIILKTNEESRITEFETPVIGYELSENGKCPPHCRQCISNYQCTLCESGYQNYVGTKENDTNPILCYPNPPGEGYYITTQYVPGKNFYFTCIFMKFFFCFESFINFIKVMFLFRIFIVKFIY